MSFAGHDDHATPRPWCRLCGLLLAGGSRPAPGAAGACDHLGAATGEKVECPSCQGRTALFVFRCEVHGTCTQGRRLPGLACCDSQCPSRSPGP